MNRGVRELHMKLAIATFAKLINTEIKLLACRSEKNTQQCSWSFLFYFPYSLSISFEWKFEWFFLDWEQFSWGTVLILECTWEKDRERYRGYLWLTHFSAHFCLPGQVGSSFSHALCLSVSHFAPILSPVSLPGFLSTSARKLSSLKGT